MSKLFLLLGILLTSSLGYSFKDLNSFIPLRTKKLNVTLALKRAENLIPAKSDSIKYYLDRVKNELSSKSEEGKWHFINARLLSNQGKYQESVDEYQKALRIFSVLENLIYIQATYNELGDIFLKQNDCYASINYYIENYSYLTKLQAENELKDSLLLAEVCNKLATIFKQVNNFSSAQRFYWEAYQLAGTNENSYIKILSFIEWCEMMNKLGNSKEVLPKLIQFRKSHTNLSLPIEKQLLICLTDTYQKTGNFLEAKKLYTRLFSYGVYPLTQIELMSLMNRRSQLFLFEGEYSEAIRTSNEVLDILDLKPDLQSEINVSYILMIAYFNERKFADAHEYFVKYNELKNIQNELRIENTIEFWDSKAKYEKQMYQDSLIKKQSINQQKSQNILHQQELDYRTNELISLFVILILSGFFIIAILIILKKIKEKNTQLQLSLREKEVLLKEVHHRVKNNFQIISSLLNLQANVKGNDKKAMNSLKEAQNRIYSMSLVHQQIYSSESLENVEMKVYLTDLINAISATFLKNIKNLEYKIECNNISFPLDKVVPLGLIANETISNSLKYGKNSEGKVFISITLSEENNQYKFELFDNGPGFPEGIDFNNLSSLGMELVCVLTDQLNGKWEFKNRNGAYICITFPR